MVSSERPKDGEQRLCGNTLIASTPVSVIPPSSLDDIASVIAGATACVAVDTGLGHVAAALGIPTVSIYGPTHPEQIGTAGPNQVHLKAECPCDIKRYRKCRQPAIEGISPACYRTTNVENVLEALQTLLNRKA